jgi:uncharacterized membrane protein YqaE (UPF0057 family)
LLLVRVYYAISIFHAGPIAFKFTWHPDLHNNLFGFNNEKQGEAFMELIKIICAIVLPPLGVFLQVGLGKHFWINIILTLFGYIPGIVHAIWVVAKNK